MDPREFLSRTWTPLGEVRIEKFLAGCHRELCPDRLPHSYRLLRHKGGRHAAPGAGIVAPPVHWAKPGAEDAQLQP